MKKENIRFSSLGRNTSWNFFGKLIYSISRGVLLIVIAKLGTSVMVGQYVFALSIATPAFMFSDFNLRSLFATDLDSGYRFEHYFGLRAITTLITLFFILIISTVIGVGLETIVLIIIVSIGKAFDTISDMFFGLFQKNECLNKLGLSLILKGGLSVLSMGTFIWLTHNIIYGAAGLAVAWMLVTFLFDYRNARKFVKVKISLDYRVFAGLIGLCLPLGVAILCISLTSNISNYFIEGFLGADSLGHYASLYYLVAVGDVLVNSLGQTASSRFALLYSNGKLKEFKKLIFHSSLLIAGMSFLGLILGIIAGKQILVLLYEPEYGVYKNILILIICSAMFSYLSSFLNYVTIAVRVLKIQPVVYGVILLVSVILNALLIPLLGIKGAAYSAIIISFLQFLGNLAMIRYAMAKLKPASSNQEKKYTLPSRRYQMDLILQLITVTDIDELKKYSEEWREILAENNNDIVFVDPDWVIRWWNAFNKNQNLHVILVKRENRIAGICPLMICEKRFYKEVHFIGSPQSVFMDFIVREKHREQTIELIIEYLLLLDGTIIFNLSGLQETSDNYILLKKILESKKTPCLHTSTVAPYISTENKEFESYYKKRFSSHMQKNFKREQKRLTEIGNLEYKELELKDVDEIFRLHKQRWERKLDTSGFSEKESQLFYKSLLTNHSESFQAVIRSLSLDKQVIAFQYGLLYHGRHLFLRSAHDELFSLFAPGRMLRKESIRECFVNNTRICDFGIGYEPYKFEWTDETRNIMTVLFSKSNFSSKMIFRMFYIKEKVRSIVKKNWSLVIFKRNTLGKLKYFFSLHHFKRVCNHVKTIGLSGLMKNGIRRIYCRDNLILMEKNVESYIDEDTVRNYQTRIASISDIEPLAELMNCPQQDCMKRFYQTHKCFIGFLNDRIVHYSWVSFTDSGGKLDHKLFKMENACACIYESMTASPEINPSAAYNVLLEIQAYLYDNKFKKIYMIVGKRFLEVKRTAELLLFKSSENFKTVKLFRKTILTHITNLRKEDDPL